MTLTKRLRGHQRRKSVRHVQLGLKAQSGARRVLQRDDRASVDRLALRVQERLSPTVSLGWLEHELERCDYRRPIARAIADRDPAAAATVARDALSPAAELLGSVAPSPKSAAGERT